ncbi:Ubiquinol-cytochrome c reductase iron-sulfur subunit (Rieske iron-sulfur protein) (RISP) [Candidatus Glomeribacter gigasporarum BEG34]|uniref:Ubiquinol-cytochrome c reductase iron-sulfur subunit n=1 Tax=Candidatus Glomeribacter gigasporarum BEG34 TaxID=1070319 RepID=G2J9Q0_9BURK|nr:ubiquinol-cytochrome c reductase iron-sulfur subunit [Candidatus Glomeribacter gigasporarum]CCD29497.1 Ubiquinol-cytochrome c reductase iron-sulfur subunit (Rieske iron-sulfur protein) (RISP) [Candidatus Glomeribacter gigasporarum BEG34]
MQGKQKNGIDRSRRRWLIATSVAGGMGGVAAAMPFVGSLAPSERARAAGAPVEADIGALKAGEMMTVAWRGKPVWVIRRTDQMLAEVRRADAQVADPQSQHPFSIPLPEYCRNPYRARTEHPYLLVLIGICTHLGCSPVARFQPGPQPNLPNDWPGGWLCPCHGSTFDLAGRVFKNKPAPQNLDVPRYMFLSPTRIVIGKDEQGEA